MNNAGDYQSAWSDAWKDRMRALYAETGSTRTAARMVSQESGRRCDRQTVYRAVTHTTPARLRPRLTDAMKERIWQLYIEGVADASIATILGIEFGHEPAPGTVRYQILKRVRHGALRQPT